MASSYNINITHTQEGYTLSGEIIGDTYDTNTYNYKTEVKAITYHELNIEKKDGNTLIRFIVDL